MGMGVAALEFENLRMVFARKRADDLVALDDLCLTVATGQVFGLLGPNGSGKTTAVNLLCGLLRPTAGTVRCEGVDVREDVAAVRARLGVVPQETALYNDLTARENLTFHARLYGVPRDRRAERIAEVLDLVGLTEREDDRAGTYSGGMQRRLALARALLTEPSVVVLDEPTLGVDVQSRAALWERIRGIADEGGTVLLTTNYMEEAQALADNLAIIDRGKLVTTGTPAGLRHQFGRSFIELRTDVPADQRAAVTHLPGISAAEWRPDGTVSLSADGHPETLETTLAWFTQQGHHPQLIGVRTPDLNDVFLALTGKALRDGGAA